MPRPALYPVRVAAWRLRRVTASALVVGTVWLVAHQLAPPPAPTSRVVVARHDVGAGEMLEPADLRVVRLPTELVPRGASSDLQAVLGRAVTVGIPQGLPVVGAVLAGERFSIDPPSGTVVVPVSLVAATAAGLIRPGDLVDLVAPTTSTADGGGPTTAQQAPAVLAHRAVVLDVRSPADVEDGGLVGISGDAPGDVLTLVAVSPDEGRLLASATAWGPLGAVLVP
jgi:pilus assembly protein CpaB